ncbi:MAG TPA: ABC transporter ATP-binding protein [Bryobacteraceae bacterium]|nr:ABC transporter ATP-binding protein [Bryobacteraceae bacterium]
MASDYAVETAGLMKIYRSRWTRREVRAVDDISLRVPRGTIFGLLGPNGAGKTTFVKLLLSAVLPTSGTALLFGRDAHDPEARRPIGYLPENHRFPTYFTGSGMLDFYSALSGLDTARRKKLIPEMLDLVGLGQWGSVRIGKYSKGMLQRLGLAQALIHSPQLLILDEPTDGVDPVGRRQIRDILTRFESQGVTIFINSHLLAEVETFCRDLAILHKGKVALSGKMRELTAGKGYRLSVPRAPENLPDNLIEQLRIQATSAATRDGLMDFQFPTRESANQAVDLLRAQHCEIEALAPTTSTLEDVFVRTVEGAAR